MKKSVIFTLVLLVSAFTVNAQKYALIDMEYILENIPAYARANEQLSQSSQQWQSEVEALAKEAQSLYEAYQNSVSTLTEAQRTERENAIIEKERQANELRRSYFGPEGDLAKLQERLLGPLQDQIYSTVKTISERAGYMVVLDRASASSIIYASPDIDISDEVLAMLGYSN